MASPLAEKFKGKGLQGKTTLSLKRRSGGHPDLNSTGWARVIRRKTNNDSIPARRREGVKEDKTMLSWTVTLLVIALIAALLGFTGIAGAAAGIAKILFAVFLVLFVISLFFGRRSV